MIHLLMKLPSDFELHIGALDISRLVMFSGTPESPKVGRSHPRLILGDLPTIENLCVNPVFREHGRLLTEPGRFKFRMKLKPVMDVPLRRDGVRHSENI
jgi:hypothetical protein